MMSISHFIKCDLSNKKNGMAMMIIWIVLYLVALLMTILGAAFVWPLFIIGVVWLCIGWIPFLGLKVLKPQEALALKKQIKYNVRQFNIKSKEPFHLSFSIGIAKFNGKNTDAFLSAMDDSMYEAKNMHRLMQ